jgi:hypothetical protein
MSFKDKKEKIIAILKSIGIAILSFITIFIIGKLFSLSKDSQDKQKEKIGDSLDDISDKIVDMKDSVAAQNTVINDAKEDIDKNEFIKNKIVNASINERINEAEKAGFKKG